MDKRLSAIAARAKAQAPLFVRDISDSRKGRRIMAAKAARDYSEGDSLWI